MSVLKNSFDRSLFLCGCFAALSEDLVKGADPLVHPLHVLEKLASLISSGASASQVVPRRLKQPMSGSRHVGRNRRRTGLVQQARVEINDASCSNATDAWFDDNSTYKAIRRFNKRHVTILGSAEQPNTITFLLTHC